MHIRSVKTIFDHVKHSEATKVWQIFFFASPYRKKKRNFFETTLKARRLAITWFFRDTIAEDERRNCVRLYRIDDARSVWGILDRKAIVTLWSLPKN